MGRSFQRHNRKQGKVQHIIIEARVRIMLWERRRKKRKEQSDSDLTPRLIEQILHHRGWNKYMKDKKDNKLTVGVSAAHREGKTAGPQRKAGGR